MKTMHTSVYSNLDYNYRGRRFSIIIGWPQDEEKRREQQEKYLYECNVTYHSTNGDYWTWEEMPKEKFEDTAAFKNWINWRCRQSIFDKDRINLDEEE